MLWFRRRVGVDLPARMRMGGEKGGEKGGRNVSEEREEKGVFTVLEAGKKKRKTSFFSVGSYLYVRQGGGKGQESLPEG